MDYKGLYFDLFLRIYDQYRICMKVEGDLKTALVICLAYMYTPLKQQKLTA